MLLYATSTGWTVSVGTGHVWIGKTRAFSCKQSSQSCLLWDNSPRHAVCKTDHDQNLQMLVDIPGHAVVWLKRRASLPRTLPLVSCKCRRRFVDACDTPTPQMQAVGVLLPAAAAAAAWASAWDASQPQKL